MCSLLCAQNIDSLIDVSRNETDSIPLQINNLEELVRDTSLLISNKKKGDIYYFIAFRHNYLFDLKKTISSTDKAIKFYTESGYSDYKLPLSYLMRARAKQNLGLITEAREDYNSIINDLNIKDLKHYSRSHDSFAEAHLRLAEIYEDNGNITASINHLESFIYDNPVDSFDRYDISGIYRQLAMSYNKYQEEESLLQAQKYINEAIKLYKNDNSDVEPVVLNYMQDGEIKNLLGQPAAAIKSYAKAIELTNNSLNDPFFNWLNTMSLISCADIKLVEQSVNEANKFIESAENNFTGWENPTFFVAGSAIHLCKAKISKLNGYPQQAKKHLSKAKGAIFGFNINVPAQDLQSFARKEILIETLFEEYQLDYLNGTQLESSLFKSAYFLDSLISFHLSEVYFENSIHRLQNKYSDYYRLFLDMAYEHNSVEAFYYFSEKLKSNVLTRKIKVDVQENQNLEQINNNINSLRGKVAQIEYNLFSSRQQLNIDSLKGSLIKLNYDITQLYDDRSNKYSNDIEVISDFTSFRESVKNQCIISYQFSQENLYSLSYCDVKPTITNHGPRGKIAELVNIWYQLVSQNGNVDSINIVSNTLYNLLVKPLQLKSKDILIIPDDVLFYLNFELLRNNEDQYLIQDKDIVYDLSFNLNKLHQSDKQVINKTALFIAENKDQGTLKYYQEEVSAIAKTNNSTLFLPGEFTKSDFTESMNNDDIIHYTGHSILEQKNNSFSHFIFNNNVASESNLTLAELYTEKSKCALVSIPSCNTASGSIINGEGQSSLARGFFYTGAKSVLSSLWESNDKTTATIMNSFYTYLIDGKEKSKSLRQAKLDYLDSSPDFLRHPQLWSSLVIFGNNDRVYFKKSGLTTRTTLFVIGLILIALINIFILLKLKTKKKKAIHP